MTTRAYPIKVTVTVTNMETGQTEELGDGELAEVVEVATEYHRGMPVRGVAALLFGCWVSEYPDDLMEVDDMFEESVEPLCEECGEWELLLGYTGKEEDE